MIVEAFGLDPTEHPYPELRNIGFDFDLQQSIWRLNDGTGPDNLDFRTFTFAEIADWIEANVPVEEDWPPDYVPAGWVAEMAVTGI